MDRGPRHEYAYIYIFNINLDGRYLMQSKTKEYNRNSRTVFKNDKYLFLLVLSFSTWNHITKLNKKNNAMWSFHSCQLQIIHKKCQKQCTFKRTHNETKVRTPYKNSTKMFIFLIDELVTFISSSNNCKLANHRLRTVPSNTSIGATLQR